MAVGAAAKPSPFLTSHTLTPASARTAQLPHGSRWSSTITERRYLLQFDRQRVDEQVRRAMPLLRLAAAGRIGGLTWREAIGTGRSRGLAGEEA
jgi:hypothetical protein